MTSDITSWRAAAKRGAQWLADQLDRDPPFGQSELDVNWYCKLPWAFAGTGDRGHALHALQRVKTDHLDAGTLHAPANTNWTNAVSYALGWMVPAARVVEAFDLAEILYYQLKQYVCPATGGLYSVQTARAPQDEPYFDAGIQGALIHSTLMMGDLPAARRAGNLAVWFIDHQPDRAAGIYCYFHPDRGYLTDVDDDTRFQRMFTAGGPPQPYANLGFMLQGLCRLFDVTGQIQYRDGCARLVEILLDDFADDLLSHSQNHKVAFAMIMLYRQTGQKRYRDAALTIAPLIAKNICADGRALGDLGGNDIEKQDYQVTVRTTCDSVLWLSQICDEIEGRAR